MMGPVLSGGSCHVSVVSRVAQRDATVTLSLRGEFVNDFGRIVDANAIGGWLGLERVSEAPAVKSAIDEWTIYLS
jgi:hypothetical protein